MPLLLGVGLLEGGNCFLRHGTQKFGVFWADAIWNKRYFLGVFSEKEREPNACLQIFTSFVQVY